MLVVIAILAILATVSVVGYTSFINRANVSNAETEAHQIESTIESFLMIDDEFVFSNNTNTAAAGTYTKVYAAKSGNDVLVYSVSITVTLDDPATTAVNEYKVEVGTPELHNTTVEKTSDFNGLPGTLLAVNGQLRYVYDLGANNTADADDAHVVIK